MAGSKGQDRVSFHLRDLRQNSYGSFFLGPQVLLHTHTDGSVVNGRTWRITKRRQIVKVLFPSFSKLHDSCSRYRPGCGPEGG